MCVWSTHACYHFKLDPLLRLNFTFYLINSKEAKLEFWNYTDDKPTFTFEEHYSTFCLYPNFRKLLFKIKLTFYKVKYIFSGILTVIDTKLIYNVSINNDGDKKPNFEYIIQNKFILFSFLLQTVRLYHVCVKILELKSYEYITYDGPGILSDVLKIESITKC